MIFGGYKASKLKPQLKMAVTRLQISGNKKTAIMKQQIREIAMMLADTPPKEEKARIKAEALIRDDNTVEAYELLQLNCELLSERIHLISHSRDCPPDLISSISTIIWASAVVDIPELIEIRKQFRYKYGKEFDADAMQNVGGVINERIAARLSVQPPSAYLVQTYLEKIADEHEVDWKPKVPLKAEDIANPMAAPSGYSIPVGGGSGLNPSSMDGGGGGLESSNASAPPMSPSFGIPEAPRSLASTNAPSSASTTSSKKQQSTYVPVLPTPSTPNAPSANGDEIIEEEDIFVPGTASKTPSSGGHNNRNDDDDHGGYSGEQSRSRTQSTGEGSRGSAPSADGQGGGDESYDDLAARFAALNKY
eukprot:CAMPEP_0183733772 /NCGR_PEP_ID=MMETSP0737-20130205/41976_1 /TAXON_ID=385413 /ORGANISM="Thalassiosira miniscula, Strain CCMP1093" /LENGTH=363 /DNA_ID=CAMNT_0025967095 /DNA_START=126 /DNA_END=1217 /DNA_ORIENTATION=-